MKSKIQPNGPSKRASTCLSKAGIAIEKEAIIHTLTTGKLYPFHWPPNYGFYTHIEVCRWGGEFCRKLGLSDADENHHSMVLSLEQGEVLGLNVFEVAEDAAGFRG